MHQLKMGVLLQHFVYSFKVKWLEIKKRPFLKFLYIFEIQLMKKTLDSGKLAFKGLG